MTIQRRSVRWLVPTAFAAVALGAYGTVAAKSGMSSHPAAHAHTSSMGGHHASSHATGGLKGASGDVLVGAAGSPPSGPGNGVLIVDDVGAKRTWTIPLATGANAFRAAIDHNMVYVPTLQGTTYVVSLTSHRVVSRFATPTGARIANIANADHLLVITGPQDVAAYSLPALKPVWHIHQGGNALAVVGRTAYLSSNMATTTSILNLATGRIVGSVPVGQIEDSVYDPKQHTLWLANWNNGDMTVVNTRSNRVVKVIQEKEGGGFTMTNMMGSTGGFMQLAVGPAGRHVYAASFSGNIMVYDAARTAFQGDIRIPVPMAKLSGIAIDPSGRYAYTTVESQKETVSVSLKTGRVVSTAPGVMSNRWFVVR